MTTTFEPFGVFLYDMLMDPETAEVALGLSYRPTLVPSRISSYDLQHNPNAAFSMSVPVPGKDDDYIDGQLWFVQTEEDFRKFVTRPSHQFLKLTDCTENTKLEKHSPSHATASYKVFVWPGYHGGLVSAPFDLEHFKDDTKAAFLKKIRDDRGGAAPKPAPGMALTTMPYWFFVYGMFADEDRGLYDIFDQHDKENRLISATVADRGIEYVDRIPNLTVATGNTFEGKILHVKSPQVSQELFDLFPPGYLYDSCDVTVANGGEVWGCMTLRLVRSQSS